MRIVDAIMLMPSASELTMMVNAAKGVPQEDEMGVWVEAFRWTPPRLSVWFLLTLVECAIFSAVLSLQPRTALLYALFRILNHVATARLARSAAGIALWHSAKSWEIPTPTQGT